QARTLDAAQLRLHLTDTLLQLRNGVIAQSCHFLVIILAFSFLQRELRLLHLLLDVESPRPAGVLAPAAASWCALAPRDSQSLALLLLVVPGSLDPFPF